MYSDKYSFQHRINLSNIEKKRSQRLNYKTAHNLHKRTQQPRVAWQISNDNHSSQQIQARAQQIQAQQIQARAQQIQAQQIQARAQQIQAQKIQAQKIQAQQIQARAQQIQAQKIQAQQIQAEQAQAKQIQAQQIQAQRIQEEQAQAKQAQAEQAQAEQAQAEQAQIMRINQQVNNQNHKSKVFKNNIYNGIINKFICLVPYCNAYNKFIIECLKSIENQKYPSYEVIIINDGGSKTQELKKFIKDKKNYTVLDFKENNGPAFSKWKFIEYIQKNIHNYNANDIAIIVDGDDYLLDNAFDIINNTYINNKCWCTFGETASGCNFIKNHSKNAISDDNYHNIKNRPFFSNHPRTFIIDLLKHIKENIFKYENKWLLKGTDLTLLQDIFELCGKNKISYINKNIYYYRIHDKNSFIKSSSKTENNFKKNGIEFIKKRKNREEYTEDIHIVMCCWKRVHNLEKQIKMINNQTISKRIHFHLVNNNHNERENIENIVKVCKEKYKNIKISIRHYKNKYYCFQRFIYIRDILLKNFILDYVIIIDDDQLFKNDWVEKMWNLRKPKIYTGWYCKKWTYNLSYWNGSIIKIEDCEKNKKTYIKNVDYVGTGGSLIDTSIFNESSPLWYIPNNLPKNVIVYNIEDLWLSCIAKDKMGYTLQRSFLPEDLSNNNIDRSIIYALYTTLHKEKQMLFAYLNKMSPRWII